MKIMKYAVALVALIAMTFSFSSCSKDVDPDVDEKGYYLFEFAIANQGSLTTDEVASADSLVSEVIYNGSSDRYPMYVSYDYAMNNFNTIVNKGTNSDIQTKIVNPLAKTTGKTDFTFSMTLYECTAAVDTVSADPSFTKGKMIAQQIYSPTK